MTRRAGAFSIPSVPLLAQVSIAHLVSHLHIMALPALLPLLPRQMGVGFVQLGLALSVFNVVSALVQAPMGYLVDRFGARRILMAGLLLGSFSFLSLAVHGSYAWLLVAMAFAGVANGVYHPADYALLAQGIEESRVGRAFSIHTFSGFLGGAIAPGLLLGVAAFAGTAGAFATAGLVGLLAVAVMMLPSRNAATLRPFNVAPVAKSKAGASGRAAAAVRVFTPTVLVLTLLFTLLSLSTGSVQNFSVAALVTGYGIELSLANLALTAFLFASARGVLAGGVVADRTQRHGAVAASAFAATALLIGFVALTDPPAAVLVPVLGVAGFLSGLITPSRDMLVRAAAPAGAEGRVFGIVSTGFNSGGAAGPVLFGWLIDSGHPRGIFWSAVGFMLLTVALTLLQEWHRARQQRRTVAMAG